MGLVSRMNRPIRRRSSVTTGRHHGAFLRHAPCSEARRLLTWSVPMFASKSLLAAVLAIALAACGGPPENPPPPPPPPTNNQPPTISVSGRAVNLDGLPVIGLAAVIAGHPAVNVASTGQFSIADVTAPYDLILVDGAAQHATVYRGLTRADPTIVV